MSTREEMIDWLRDAYAMERGIEVMLRKQCENDELHLGLREQARVHLEETKSHAEAVRACLEKLGSDVSTLKSGMSQLMETAKGLTTSFARDERVKDLLAAYGTEHFEIACYVALKAGAEAIGESDIAQVCDLIIPDEKRMASWLEQNLPTVVRDYLVETVAA